MKALAFHNTQFDIVDRDGQPWLQAAQIAKALGYAREDAISRIFSRNADEFTPCMSQTVNLTVSGNLQKEVRIFSLRGAHLLAMFARTKVAKEFRHWALDVLEGEAEAPAKAKRKPKLLPHGLSTDQQDAIKALVKARVDELPEGQRAKAAITCWSSLKSKFGCTYKEISPEQFTDAVSLIARVVLEGELLEPEEAKVVGRLDINYPIEDWQAKNPQQFRRDDPNSPDLLVGYGDLLLSKYSPCLELLDKLHNAGYCIDGAYYEFRSYQNLMAQMDMTVRMMAGSIKNAFDNFEHDRRRLQKYPDVKGRKA
ncbi:BRO family protein [Pseudomonas sp. GD04058]|uniref:BRO-N domain-containing protein n=1 Tax=Pseudomonas sp. GD04058 TaxID=2975429 RepID=UPI0024491224|nr:BRO family protein [Pseudomonas sp. GD04058]MDG9884086.1 BRO family protein [Pseudomonas sp. GD04058]